MARLSVRAVSRIFPGGLRALRDLSLELVDAEFFAILGPSGSGKSTLLRTIAGLEPIDSGTITLGDRRIDRLEPRERNVALTFQHPVIYPHLSVRKNLEFSLQTHTRTGTRVVRERELKEIAGLLRIEDLLERMPGTLSGGQKQRVVLGRAILRRPELLLLDEPFGSLDAPLRLALREDLARLQRRSGITTLLVTHDQEEALAIGDRIAVLDRGELRQTGRPQELYEHPESLDVARFVGSPPINLIPCKFDVAADALKIRGTTIPNPPSELRRSKGETELILGVRPGDFSATRVGNEMGPVAFRTDRASFRGATWQAIGEIEGWLQDIVVEFREEPTIGHVVNLSVPWERARWFSAATGQALATGVDPD